MRSWNGIHTNRAKYTSMKKRLFLAGLYPEFMLDILLSGI